MPLIHLSYLAFLRNPAHVQQLDFLPQELTLWETTFTILLLIFRQLLQTLGLYQQVKQHDEPSDSNEHMLPDLRLSMPLRVSQADLRTYRHAVHFEDHAAWPSDPTHTCLLLSALSEPAMLLLLGHRECPVRPLGSVNVRNKFELHNDELCAEQHLLAMNACEVRARLLPRTRRAKRGLEFDFQVDIVDLSAGAATLIFRQIFTILQFKKFKNHPVITPQNDTFALDNFYSDSGDTVDFQISSHDPRAWARVCRDYNPIHVSRLAAKLFGFANVIAHGNHVLALALSKKYMEGKHKVRTRTSGGLVMKVEFKRPVIVTTRKTLLMKSMTGSDDSEQFCIVDNGKICIVASIVDSVKAWPST